MMKTVVIYIPVAICPKCKARLYYNPHAHLFRCWDCKTIYEVEDIGQTEREFICKERKKL